MTARDFKRPRRAGLGGGFAGLREFGLGLALGLAVAGIIFIADHRAGRAAPDALQPVPRRAAGDDPGHSFPRSDRGNEESPGAPNADAPADASAADPGVASAGKYDFYQMLPKFEVVVPEREQGSHLSPTAQIDQPGTYFLQVGSYRDPATANRVRAQVAKLGIAAAVQRVAVDADVWQRVRVGPIRDLAVLNRLRRQLQASKLDSLVIRVDD